MIKILTIAGVAFFIFNSYMGNLEEKYGEVQGEFVKLDALSDKYYKELKDVGGISQKDWDEYQEKKKKAKSIILKDFKDFLKDDVNINNSNIENILENNKKTLENIGINKEDISKINHKVETELDKGYTKEEILKKYKNILNNY